MSAGRRAIQLNAAGSIKSQDSTYTVTFVLTAGAGAAARAMIRENGSGGTDVLEISAAAGTSSAPITFDIRKPYLQAISGAGATLTAIL